MRTLENETFLEYLWDIAMRNGSRNYRMEKDEVERFAEEFGLTIPQLYYWVTASNDAGLINHHIDGGIFITKQGDIEVAKRKERRKQ